MTRPIQDAYIVAATRTAVGKAPRGMYRNTRPDDLLAHVLRAAMAQCPGVNAGEVEDVIVGCAMPEAEQGMNVARVGLLLAGFPDTVSGTGGRSHSPRRGGRDDRGRHREHEHGADGRQQDLVQPGDLRA
jgi:hypothetical protein